MTKAFLVIGVKGTGSGTLTWPEDFDLRGVFLKKEEADDEALELNTNNGFVYDENGDRDEDEEGEDMDDVLEYEVHEVDVLTIDPDTGETIKVKE